MKRLLRIIILLVIAAGLAACSAPAGMEQSPPPPQAASASATASPSPTPSPTPEPTPLFVPDTDLPENLGLPDDTPADSSDYLDNSLREDKDNIYYAWNNFNSDASQMILFCVNKKTCGVKIVSKDVCSYALCGGKVYYSSSYRSGSIIKSYDPVTGKTKQIQKFKNGVYDMASYKGRLYFTFETVYHEDYDIPLTDLYVMKPDGSGQKKIQDNAAYFCIYKDIIYYNESSWPDGAPIDKCNLNGSSHKQILDWTDYFTAVCDNKIYYYDGSNEISMDISSGKTTQLPSSLDFYGDNDGCFAPLGKYILCLSEGMQITPNITAFDMVSNTTYNLMELEKDNYYDMYTSPYGACVVWTDSTGKINIDRIVFSSGKASLKKAAEIIPPRLPPETAPPDEIPTPADIATPEPTGSPEPALSPPMFPDEY